MAGTVMLVQHHPGTPTPGKSLHVAGWSSFLAALCCWLTASQAQPGSRIFIPTHPPPFIPFLHCLLHSFSLFPPSPLPCCFSGTRSSHSSRGQCWTSTSCLAPEHAPLPFHQEGCPSKQADCPGLAAKWSFARLPPYYCYYSETYC